MKKPKQCSDRSILNIQIFTVIKCPTCGKLVYPQVIFDEGKISMDECVDPAHFIEWRIPPH